LGLSGGEVRETDEDLVPEIMTSGEVRYDLGSEE